jgi:hypothetical protein
MMVMNAIPGVVIEPLCLDNLFASRRRRMGDLAAALALLSTDGRLLLSGNQMLNAD